MHQSQLQNSPTSPIIGSEKITSVLCGADIKDFFENSRWFSTLSYVDVLDIRGSKGVMRRHLDDAQISSLLKEHSTGRDKPEQEPVHTRIIFIDGLESDTDRLHITSPSLQKIFTTYNISSQLASLLLRQHMPGRIVKHDPKSKRPTHHQFWYSTIFRSMESLSGPNWSRTVLNWSRFCVWEGRDISKGITTMLVLRCPEDTKSELALSFADSGDMVMQHPMLVHAFLVQNALVKAADFSQNWANPIYKWEQEKMIPDSGSAAEFTARSRAFLTLSRQITQVATDYEILHAAIESLKMENEWVRDNIAYEEPPSALDIATTPTPPAGKLLPDYSDDIWSTFISDCHLLKTYANLYETRTKIGINECFAMVSQRDSELTIQMAKESTQIARTSHQDGQSLRVIQILSMVFLPASLCSGIFGMGFFNTGPDDHGNVSFSVSSNWWWFLALTIPLTVCILVTMGGFQAFERWKENRKQIQAEPEVEKLPY